MCLDSALIHTEKLTMWQDVRGEKKSASNSPLIEQGSRMFGFGKYHMTSAIDLFQRRTKSNQPFGQEVQMVLVLRSLREVPGKYWQACEQSSPSIMTVFSAWRIDMVHNAATHWFSRISGVSLRACKTIHTLPRTTWGWMGIIIDHHGFLFSHLMLW